MTDIIVTRRQSMVTGTPGAITAPGTSFNRNSLELPWRNNQSGISCIVADTYGLALWYSPTMKRKVLRLEDKHSRKDCLIHPGNFAGDVSKGYETQVHGCTLPGRGYGLLSRDDGKGMQLAILHSGDTLLELIALLDVGPHTITYKWAEGCSPEDLTDYQSMRGQ